jgi:protein O-mannosyl-transferase
LSSRTDTQQTGSECGLVRPTCWPAPLVVALLIAVTLVTYWRVSDNGFVRYDDPAYVTDNQHVHGGLSWQGLRWAFTSFDAANWHPLTWMDHMADVSVFGMRAGWHHVMSLVLHILTTVMLLAFLTYTTGRQWASAFVAAAFAVHPLHVESVAWAAERKDALSAFFFMATILAYAIYVKKGGRHRYLMVLGLYAMGLMSKPMLVTLPLVLLMLDWWPLERATGTPGRKLRLIAEKLPMIVLAAASCIVTIMAQRHAIVALDAIPLPARLANAAISWWRYAYSMVWPAELSVLYPYHTPNAVLGLAAGITLLLVTTALLWLGRRQRYLAVGWLWYLVTLIPVIGIVQVGEQTHADRYTYIPLTGLFILIAWSAASLSDHLPTLRRVFGVLAVSAVAACCILTWRQVGYWKDTYTLCTRATSVTRDNVKMLTMLATSCIDRGQFEEAAGRFGQILGAHPDNAEAMSGMGVVCLRTGQYERSVDYCLRAVRIRPDLKENWVNAAMADEQMSRLDLAEDCLRQAVKADPQWALAYGELGRIVGQAGRTDEAIAYYRKGLTYDPRLQLAHVNLGLLEADRGNFTAAAGEFRAQLAVAEDAETWSYLGGALTRIDDLNGAIQAYTESLRLAPDSAASHYNLGIILVRMGRRSDAAGHIMRAVELDPANQQLRQYYDSLESGSR